MKRLLLGLASTILSTASFGVVADRFECQLELMDRKTKEKSKSRNTFFVSRLPVNLSTSTEIQITEAYGYNSIDLKTKNGNFGLSFNLNYKHAIKFDDLNQATRARQASCFTISTSFCKEEIGPRRPVCRSGSEIACLESSADPFEDNSIWTEVPLIDRVPMFLGESLGQMTDEVQDDGGVTVGTAKVNCRHLGTFK